MKATETGVVGPSYRRPSVKVIEVQVQSIIASSKPGPGEAEPVGEDPVVD